MRKKMMMLAVTFFLILVIITALVLILGKQNKQGKINSKAPGQTETAGLKTFDDGYITWQYPSKYSLSKIATTDGRVLTNIELTATGTRIVVNLSRLTQSLDDLPSVQLRRARKDEYTEEVGMLGGLRGLLFRTTDKKERVLFVNNKYTILTIVMTVTTDDFVTSEKEWNDFLATVRWK